jgi:hypothetical protein
VRTAIPSRGIRPRGRGVGADGRSTVRVRSGGDSPYQARRGRNPRAGSRPGQPGRARARRARPREQPERPEQPVVPSRRPLDRAGRAGSANSGRDPSRPMTHRRTARQGRVRTGPRRGHIDRSAPPSPSRAKADRSPGVQGCTPGRDGSSIVGAIGANSCGLRSASRRTERCVRGESIMPGTGEARSRPFFRTTILQTDTTRQRVAKVDRNTHALFAQRHAAKLCDR